MTTIALDAMGADDGVRMPVGGAARLSLEDRCPEIVLVGDEQAIRRCLDEVDHKNAVLHVVHTDQAIPMDCEPRDACRDTPRASMKVAADIVQAGDADALVSGGNTGAVILTCAQTFARLPHVERCALGAVFPTEARRGEKDDPFSLILDAGLTIDARAQDLVGFALMGSAYAERVSSNPHPKVALLSNGSEKKKGTREVVEAHAALDTLHAQGVLNFIGNIEGMDIPRGTADVIVADGFIGNIVLKMLEGVAETVKNLGRYAMRQNVMYKAGLALLAPGVKQLKRVTDWRQYGGAPILGFDRVCIKAHGRSEERAFKNALKVAQKTVATGLADGIKTNLAALHEAQKTASPPG